MHVEGQKAQHRNKTPIQKQRLRDHMVIVFHRPFIIYVADRKWFVFYKTLASLVFTISSPLPSPSS